MISSLISYETPQPTPPNVAPQVVLLMPEDALRILTQFAFPRQRALRQRWIAELADIICKGTWATTTVTLAYCGENGRVYLLDGYHRLSAIIAAETPAPVLINLENVASLADVGILYTRLDRGMPRSIGDGLIARDMGNQTQLSVSTLRSAVAAINVVQAGFRYDSGAATRRGYDEKFDALEGWTNEIHAYENAVAGAPSQIISRLYASAIMAVGLTLMRYQQEKATTFFSGAARSIGLAENSAQHTFLTRILQGDAGSIRKTGVPGLCRLTASCWNAYYEGRTLERLWVRDTTAPIILLGTPHSRRAAEAAQSS